jgi:hypothetical protein
MAFRMQCGAKLQKHWHSFRHNFRKVKAVYVFTGLAAFVHTAAKLYQFLGPGLSMDRVFLVELAGAHIPYFIGAVGLAFQSAIPSKSLIYGMHIHACAIHPMFNIYQDVSLGRPVLVVMSRRVAAVLFFIALQKSTLGAVCIPLWSMSIFAAVLYLGICWVMSSGLLAESILHQKPPEEPLSQFAMLALIALLVASPGVPWLVAKKSCLTSFGDLRSDVEVSKQLPEAKDAAKAEFHTKDRQSSDELHEWENDLEMQRSEIDIGTFSEQSLWGVPRRW